MTESNDADFQLNADMMVHDIDDERTIEEEEMMESGEEFSNEVNNLQKVCLRTFCILLYFGENLLL